MLLPEAAIRKEALKAILSRRWTQMHADKQRPKKISALSASIGVHLRLKIFRKNATATQIVRRSFRAVHDARNPYAALPDR